MKLLESAYDWAKIPEDLPRENLVFITAKTTRPTIHKTDPKYPVRLFNPKELHEAARSLARRPVGVNHGQVIPTAFSIDSQWNEETQSVEALIFLPTDYINLIRRMESAGTPVKYSVEYTWRDERRTETGVEFVGLVFDRVDLVIGMNAGDRATSGKLVETDLDVPHLFESIEGVLVGDEYKHLEESADSVTERLGEPFAHFKNWDACIAHARAKGKSNPDAWCGAIKAKAEPHKKETTDIHLTDSGIQTPELPMNTMTSIPDVTPQTLPKEPPTTEEEPHVVVSSVGAVSGSTGPIGADPQAGNPDKNLNQEPAPENIGEMHSKKECGNPLIEDSKVLQPDKSIQSTEEIDKDEKKLVESQEPEKKKEEPKKEPEKPKEPEQPVAPAEPVKAPEPPKPDPKDDEIKGLKEAVTKLQGTVATATAEKEKAVKEAEKRGKEAVISKIREVIPVSGFFGGNIAVTAQKRVIDDVNRKLREVE